MKDLLQGKPIKHPLHPILVHIPIALFMLSFLLDIASLAMSENNGFVRASFYGMGVGVVMALVAAVPGFVDYVDIRNDHPAKQYATAHMLLNLAAVGLYALNLGIRYSSLGSAKVDWIPFVLSVVAVILLSVSGYLGGAMVYGDGIGVGRHRRQTETPQNTIEVSLEDTKEARDKFFPVASTDSLGENETLRVSAHGTIMVVTKWKGEYFAFQEFCPHRFGPLSEGALCNGEVECPWHRSRFDIRSGKVKEGPAKVDLKTFPVQIRDGKIFVSISPKP